MVALKNRRGVLLVCLTATLSASAWTYWRQGREQTVEVSAAVDVRGKRPPPAAPAPTAEGSDPTVLDLSISERPPALSPVSADPFAVKSWQVAAAPPPPPPPPPPPAEPTAPALPFVYIGRQEEVGNAAMAVFYFAKGDEAYAVRAGEKLDHDYQFDGMHNGTLSFTFLPLSIQQLLPIGATP